MKFGFIAKHPGTWPSTWLCETLDDDILAHRDIFTKHLAAFISQCESRRAVMEPAFNEIDTLEFVLGYEQCLDRLIVLMRAFRTNDPCTF